MLLNMKEILKIARKNNFAVGAFNICDSLLFKTVITDAEKNQAPVIIQIAPPEVAYTGYDFFKYVIARIEDSKVPCVLHLDHGKSFEDCKLAIDNGFTSVMIDASLLSFEENIKLTKRVVDYAHKFNVSVEAEIGTIGELGNSFEGGAENIIYTKPEDVKTFIDRTDVDSLAIAIGTAHGIYPKNKVPKLRLDILENINKITTKPLVLHGGSSNNDEEIAKACKMGINKVNIASDYRKAFFSELTNTLNESHPFWTPDVYKDALLKAQEVLDHKMKLFDCIGKANLYKRDIKND